MRSQQRCRAGLAADRLIADIQVKDCRSKRRAVDCKAEEYSLLQQSSYVQCSQFDAEPSTSGECCAHSNTKGVKPMQTRQQLGTAEQAPAHLW